MARYLVDGKEVMASGSIISRNWQPVVLRPFDGSDYEVRLEFRAPTVEGSQTLLAYEYVEPDALELKFHEFRLAPFGFGNTEPIFAATVDGKPVELFVLVATSGESVDVSVKTVHYSFVIGSPSAYPVAGDGHGYEDRPSNVDSQADEETQ